MSKVAVLDSQRFFNVKRWGAKGDGITDDVVAIEACVRAAQNGGRPEVGTTGTFVYFPPGQYRISRSIVVDRFFGGFIGSGIGQSPSFANYPGLASVIAWGGDDESPMFLVMDSHHVTFQHLRLEGGVNKPTYGIEFRWLTGDTEGENSHLNVFDCRIGRYWWTTRGATEPSSVGGDMQAGIGFTGNDIQNDQFRIDRTLIRGCDIGLALLNTMSIWSSCDRSMFEDCGIGALVRSSTEFRSCEWNRCGVDLDIRRRPWVRLSNPWSEQSKQWIKMSSGHAMPGNMLDVDGGVIQCNKMDPAQGGSGVLIDAYPSSMQSIILRGVRFDSATATTARIHWGPTSAQYNDDLDDGAPGAGTYVNRTGSPLLKVEWCQGLFPEQLYLGTDAEAGAFWSALSRGVVEWQSRNGNTVYQFRNEMAGAGGPAGTRPTLDKTAWDAVVAGAAP